MATREESRRSAAASLSQETKYLEFNQLQALIEYLLERQIGGAHLDDSIRHTPTNVEGVGSVDAYAVVSQDLGDCMVVWGQLIQRDIDVYLCSGSEERQAFHDRTQERLAQVKALLEEQGLQVRPGRWSYQPPHYL